MRGRGILLSILATTLALGCASPPERPHKVGRVERTYTDPTRLDWAGDGPRPLRSTIWFPTDSDSAEERWLIGNRLFPLFRAGWSVFDAPLSEREPRYPLVVLSHGTGGATAQVSWLAEALSSHGYVVAAVNHHGNTAIEEATPHGFFLWWERASDLRILIDRVSDDPMFRDRVDPTRIGAAGFSLGGYTVLELAGARTDLDQIERYCEGRDQDPSCRMPPEAPFSKEDLGRHVDMDPRFRESMDRHRLSYADSRVRSIAAIAPAAGMSLTLESLAGISLPVLVIAGERDTTAPAKSNSKRVASSIPGSRLHVLPGVSHYTFLAECGPLGRATAAYLCDDAEGVSRREAHENASALVLRFFDETLAREHGRDLDASRDLLVGSFVVPSLPHPILAPEQQYFRPSSAPPDTEWIAIVPERLAERVRLDVPVRIRGRAIAIDLGGAPGTRAAYRGTKLLISEIQDLDRPE